MIREDPLSDEPFEVDFQNLVRPPPSLPLCLMITGLTNFVKSAKPR